MRTNQKRTNQMKTIVVVISILLAIPAFALPIQGVWYMPPSQYAGNNFNPETLVEIGDSDVMTTQRIFPKSTQKVTTKDQIQVGDSTFTFVKAVQAETCPGLHDGSMAGASFSYSVSGNVLTLSMNGHSIQMTRANPEQIGKFNSTAEGCN